jgi:predicted ATP-grasp superfamily ATP-dependent carboligase
MGRAMRDALVADAAACPGWRVRVADGGTGPAAPAGEPVRALPGEALADFVARQAAVHDAVWLVAPESAGLLATLQQAVPAGRWLGCSAEAIALAGRKQATLEALHARGIATPLGCAALATHWVVKPDDGAGALATRRWADAAQARADQQARHTPIEPMTLEPWVDGEPGSLTLLATAQGVQLLAANRQQISVDDDGWVHYHGVARQAIDPASPRWAAALALAAQVRQAIPGLAGIFGIDVVWHTQAGPVVIEVNPRLTCAYVGLSQALGRNLAAQVLAAHANTAQLEAAHG